MSTVPTTPTDTSPMTGGASATDRPTRARLGTVVAAGAIAALTALVGNTVVAQVALAAGASEDFQQLTIGVYGRLTVVGVLGGLVGWMLVRRSARAASILRWLIPAVLAVSFVPDVLVGFSGGAGVSWGAVLALMVMHLVVAGAAVLTFSRLLPVTRSRA